MKAYIFDSYGFLDFIVEIHNKHLKLFENCEKPDVAKVRIGDQLFNGYCYNIRTLKDSTVEEEKIVHFKIDWSPGHVQSGYRAYLLADYLADKNDNLKWLLKQIKNSEPED